MVLGKLSVPGRPTDLDNSRARAYCACSRCGLGCFDIFLSSIFSLLFLSHSRYRLKYCHKGPTNNNVYSKVSYKNACRSIDSDLTSHPNF